MVKYMVNDFTNWGVKCVVAMSWPIKCKALYWQSSMGRFKRFM